MIAAEAELARELCAVASRRAARRDRLAALAAEADTDRFLAHVRYQRSATALTDRLAGLAPEPAAARLRAAADERRRAQGIQAAVAERAGEELGRRLGAAGIRALVLKGVPLSRALYGDPAARPSSDVDVLVDREHLPRALEVLADPAAAWSRLPLRDARAPRLHHELRSERPWLPPVELHWRVHWYEEAFSRELLREAEEVGGALRATPEHDLVALLLYYQRDGFLGLRLAADLAAWWDARGGELRPGVLADLLGRHPALAPALRAAAGAAERVVGFPARVVLEPLRARRPTRREATAVRTANPSGRGSREQQHADVALVDALLAPAGELAGALGRALLPGAAHIVGGRQLPAAHRAALVATHPAKTAVRLAWAGGRAARPLA